MVVALALLAALAGIVMPLMLDRTRDLSFDETVLQLERAASVARAESQRESKAVLFEVRWSERDGAYRIGTARLAERGERAGESDVVSELPRFEGQESGLGESPADFPSFQSLLTLPVQYEIRRRMPEEYLEAPSFESGPREAGGLAIGGAPEQEWGPVEDWGDPQRPQRLIIAVFLPDGTLIGEERLYLLGPGQRVAAITTNRWLGALKVERMVLDVSASRGDDESVEAGNRAGEAPPTGTGPSPESPGGTPEEGRP